MQPRFSLPRDATFVAILLAVATASCGHRSSPTHPEDVGRASAALSGVLVDATFDGGAANGFSYSDDTFRGTSAASYASGAGVASGGNPGGAQRISLGGINSQVINGMSGGITTSFSLSEAMSLTLSFDYKLTQTPNYESTEFSQVLASVDGLLRGSGANDYVDQITGDGDGGPSRTTGWKSFQVTLGLTASGAHSLIVGGYNNRKDASNESTEVLIDNVRVVGAPLLLPNPYLPPCDDASCCPAGTIPLVLTPNPDALGPVVAPGKCVVALAGSDNVSVSATGPSAVLGGPDSDVIQIGSGPTTVRGGAGDDAIHAFGAAAVVLGDKGNDNISTDNADDFVVPGPGGDTVATAGGNDVVVIYDLCEVVAGESLDGGPGFDTLVTPVPISQLQALGVTVQNFENVRIAANPCLSECGPTGGACGSAIHFTEPIESSRGIAFVAPTDGPVRVAGQIVPSFSAIRSIAVTVDGAAIAPPPAGTSFVLDIPLPTSDPGGPYIERTVTVSAVNAYDQTTNATLRLRIARASIPGELVVRFIPMATPQQRADVIQSVGGTVLRVDEPSHTYRIAVGTGANQAALLATLRQRSEIAYALAPSTAIPAGICGPGAADPLIANGLSWHMSGSASFGLIGQPAYLGCEVGVAGDCPGFAPDCVQNICYSQNWGLAYLDSHCEASEDCKAPQFFTTPASNNVCSTVAGFAYCRGLDGTHTVTRCAQNSDCPSNICVPGERKGVCVSRGGPGFDLGWDQAQPQVCSAATASNNVLVAVAESVGACPAGSTLPPDRCGMVDVHHPELARRIWTNFLECCGNAVGCPADASGLAICSEGEVVPDGAPGVLGIDDDGDGTADFDDPEVKALIVRLCTNRIDDDGVGGADTCPNDGSFDGQDLTCCAGEDALARFDDDEDGYIDDVHGFDFYNAAESGELAGSTLGTKLTEKWSSHATSVATIIAGELDNGVGSAGVHPNVRIMTLSAQTSSWVEAMHYAATHGVHIVNASMLSYPTGCTPHPSDPAGACTGQKLLDYQAEVRANDALFRDGLDPNTLYVIAAGNEGTDLTKAPIPDPGGQCPDGVPSIVGGVATRRCRWQFPANVNTYLHPIGNGPDVSVVVTATNNANRFADPWSEFTHAASFGSTLPGGANAVDFAAPGDQVQAGTTFEDTGLTGTSFSAPMVSGLAAMLMSQLPEPFLHQPLETALRIRDTLKPCQSALPNRLGCEGAMQSPGSVDLGRALDTAQFPVRPRPLFRDESFRLGNFRYESTHDLQFIDMEGNGTIDFLLEVFGGPFPSVQQPRLFHWNATSRTFAEESSRLPAISGNYQRAAVSDLNLDGCADIALARFFHMQSTGQGGPNVLLLQNKQGATCQGTFRDATNETVGGNPRLPTRNDVGRDVKIIDLNGDNAPDILFTFFPLPTDTFSEQILINNGSGAFVDETATRILTPLANDAHRSLACDVTHDGFVDIIQAVNGNQNRLLVNDGTGHFSDEATARGFPLGTGFSHDVECQDFTGDGVPELLFARRDALGILFLRNDGSGHFTDESFRFGGNTDTSQDIEICDLDGNGTKEVLIGNGDILQFKAFSNRVLRLDGSTGHFVDASDLGFRFAELADVTEVMRCGDLDGQNGVEAVVIANTGLRNWLYLK